jgi:predicted secreted hydrolase
MSRNSLQLDREPELAAAVVLAGGDLEMAKMTAAQALTAQLASLPTGLRPAADVYALMLETAAKLTPSSGLLGAQQAATIYQMLGPAAGYGDLTPPTSVHFPADHRLHLDCGNEWYWLSANLDAEGPQGPVRIGLLIDMLRIRVVSKAVQAQAGWSDAECQVIWNAVTAVVSSPAGSAITRRNPNVQWAPVGGTVEFPEGGFVYRCGPDVMLGPQNVLPLEVVVADGDNISLQLSLSSGMPPTSAFFLQGQNGVTPPPTAGIYYSWPQLSVSGGLTIAGAAYEAAGVGWIDHQLLAPTVPASLPPPLQISGWNWCQFNFDNGEAFTAAAFQTGSIGANKLVPYGFFIRPLLGGWQAEPIIGGLAIDGLIPTLDQVFQPTAWTYQAGNFPGAFAPSPLDITITTAPWHPDGSFVTGDLAVPSEVPVSAAMAQRGTFGQAVTGRGYCETVGFEPRESYMQRAIAFLKGGPFG